MHLSEYKKLSNEQISQLCKDEKPNYYGKIIQLDLNYKIIKEWNSLIEASRIGGFNFARISDCCLKKQKTHLGFIWMHYNDYYKLIDNFVDNGVEVWYNIHMKSIRKEKPKLMKRQETLDIGFIK